MTPLETKVLAWLERRADKHLEVTAYDIENPTRYAFSEKALCNAHKAGAKDALAAAKLLGKIEALEEAVYMANARRKKHNNSLEESIKIRIRDASDNLEALLKGEAP
jgi:Ni,Fe-hydrogenase maturation factor